MQDYTRRLAGLRAALDPASIAVIGASDNPNKVGGRPLKFLQRFGFRGTVYPVNPARKEVQSLAAFPSLDALPKAPELAIVAVAGEDAFRAVDQCADMGAQVAVIMTGGLTETDPVEGKAKERRMVEHARARGMRIVGPNSQGLANFGTGAIASFSTMFVEVEPQDGPIGIVSQSGAMSVVPYGLLRRRGIGIRHSHATGNDSDVTACELASVVAEDPGLKLLLLYLEGLPDPHQLARAARVARDRGLPVIAIKGGRTPAGAAAAASHTGALASEERVIDAFFEQHGILRARDMHEMLSGVELYLQGWQPRGRRLVAISTSGATCVMAADTASQTGLQLAQLQPATVADLRAALPPIANAINPVDLTGAMLTDSSLFGRVLDAVGPDEGADLFFAGFPVSGVGYDVPRFAQEAAAFAKKSGKPLVVATPQPNVAAAFSGQGVPVFPFDAEGVAALERFVAHHELMARARARAAELKLPEAAQPATEAGGLSGVMLNEADSLALARAHGVPVVPHRVCRTLAEAVDAFRELGGPVVLKGCSSQVAHKTELGIVRLHLGDEAAVEQAWRDVKAALATHGIADEGVIVARMAKGRREMLIGAHRDAVFGPCVVFGDGGKYVEAMPDLRLLLTPFTRGDVMRELACLRMAPLFQGVRGEPALDVDALADAVMAVQALIVQDGIASLDINPVLVSATGEGLAAVDAVVFQQTTRRHP
ncbi:MAG: acetate--CoA ligase family protein [Bordetella sp.]|nr:acetate--CoA ligase family protein [Bordetella sp.]